MYKVKYNADIILHDNFNIDACLYERLWKNRDKYIQAINRFALTLLPFPIEVEIEDLEKYNPEYEGDTYYYLDFTVTSNYENVVDVENVHSDLDLELIDYIKRKFKLPDDCTILITWELI